ncbi:MAG TPA: DUF1697 domain-containing protein [Polyangiaceae bacterium]|nr:DUF1697 domain-containing protein [Polyangiaceae bacterium]
MTTTRYVALLRGINVGGNNVIKMTELRAEFEKLGHAEVATYIASGNVLFSSPTANRRSLVKAIETALSVEFAYESRIVLLSAREIERVIADAPPGFGKDPKKYRYDVLFVKEPLTPEQALAEVPTKPGVDEAHAGRHALYFRRLVSRASESRLSRLVQLPVYRSVTIRNWNTTQKLLALTSG